MNPGLITIRFFVHTTSRSDVLVCDSDIPRCYRSRSDILVCGSDDTCHFLWRYWQSCPSLIRPASWLTGTPADRMLRLLRDIQSGTMPSIQDISFVRSAVLESLDIYKPMDVAKQLLQTGGLDVSAELSQQTSQNF